LRALTLLSIILISDPIVCISGVTISLLIGVPKLNEMGGLLTPRKPSRAGKSDGPFVEQGHLFERRQQTGGGVQG